MQRHPGEISPGEAFDLFYFLRNPLDGNTYYPQAKVYDLRTGEVLLTTALDQAATNTRLYIKTVQAPPDSAGIGRSIVAIATLYTDSGFTTKSNDYEEQEQYFLIKAAIPFMGGGAAVDYREIKTIVEEAIGDRLKKLPKPPAMPDMPFEAIFGAIGALQREVNRIPKDAPDLSALSAVQAKLGEMQTTIENLPTPEKIDLSPLTDVLARALRALTELRSAVTGISGTVKDTFNSERASFVNGALKQLEKELDKLMSKQELTIPLSSLINRKPQEATPIDVSHLM